MFWRERAHCSALFGTLLLLLTACTDPAMQPSPLIAAAPTEAVLYRLQSTVKAKPSGGNSRALEQGTRWIEYGSIAEGTIYKPRDTVLTVEHFDVHEAYVVVRDGSWVGFWLPVEKAFVPVSKPVPIELQHLE